MCLRLSEILPNDHDNNFAVAGRASISNIHVQLFRYFTIIGKPAGGCTAGQTSEHL